MSSSSSLSSRCQDCGNQAKKECVYYRCRTCCKSKGYHCQTHIKSTWVPLYRRRQRQVFHRHHLLQAHGPTRAPNLASSSQGFEDELDQNKRSDRFPAEVSAAATFQSVRVSSVADDGVAAQHAYQASVVIGGHVFKGILYDQGPAAAANAAERSTTTATASYCGLVAGDHRAELPAGGLMFHQLPNFVNPTAMMTSRSTPDHEQAVDYVPAEQRPLFVGSSSMFQSAAGMQFFPNRE